MKIIKIYNRKTPNYMIRSRICRIQKTTVSTQTTGATTAKSTGWHATRYISPLRLSK